ncbi:molybdopterin molybdenumtransferase MoeA [Sinomonas cellulolyticus]|uniref:Molybdopterin molybdenumtransferase n=1 Tax=Sinomonas cellulolyticus TaxID=2801916 RepID=A0ABS1K006_9MICC|nr:MULTISPECIES: molybdopterin-binding protein [Sinomonas]MBL0704999.1 molybdopterin molybdenumtransferase MoeA [Sinomonas cellulolyticus]GHG53693.1 molybdopterin molybdenumtransferase MoeA [Sinomonas sp. KCTC 49339]
MTSGPHPAGRHHALHLTWSEARAAAAAAALPQPPTEVPLGRASGRTLAGPLTALRDMPHYTSSAMDGWAVCGTGPWILAEPGEPLTAHQAAPIVTGGVLPHGARSVLRREHGEVVPDDDGLPHLRLAPGAPPGAPGGGADLRPAGEEASEGDVLLKAGTLMGPAQLALAALAGYDSLRVTGRPNVKLVRTGGEVVEAGLPGPGLVRDVFSYLLPPLLEAYGGILVGHEKIGDAAEEWEAALADSAGRDVIRAGHDAGAAPSADGQADVVVTTGGTGKGGSDHFRDIVARMGGRLVVDGVAMRPGHPTVLAELPDGRFFLGLPGNPLAAVVGLVTLGEPLLAALCGRKPLAAVELPSGEVFEPELKRTRIVPFRRMYGMASPAAGIGSGMLRGLARADGFMVVPPHGVELGSPVECLPLPWGRPLGGATPSSASGAGGDAKPKARRRSVGSKEPVDWSALDR